MIAISTYSGECDGLGLAAERAGQEEARRRIMAWIKCSERLPGDEELVLAYHPNNHSTGPDYVQESKITIKYGHYCRSGRCCYGEITHWMPLPEPPKDAP